MKITTIELAPLTNQNIKGFNLGEYSIDIPAGAKVLDSFVKAPRFSLDSTGKYDSIRRIFLKILEPTSISTKNTIKTLLVDEGKEFVLNTEFDHNPFELTIGNCTLNLHLFVSKGSRF